MNRHEKTKDAAMNELSTDLFFFDHEALRAITDENTVRQGLVFFKESRVFEINQENGSLCALVEDERSDLPVAVAIDIDSHGSLQFSCGCGDGRDGVCCHQVAVLCAYADQCGEAGQLLSAADSAIKDRVKRGRSEVQVESLSGRPWFGTWRAASATSSTHFPQQYRVAIRSLYRRANFCSCPDFANNQLGTCKHIEAVLHKVAKHPEYEQFRNEPAPVSYVYLAWDVDNAPRLCLHRSIQPPRDLAAVFDTYFDAAGMFTGRLPDDFFRFADQVEERDDIHLGEDSIDYARQQAAATAHQLRSREIQRQITATGGRLPGIKARLYPYQVEGTAFLAGTGRALLADDMGLGKTLQAISASAWLVDHDEVRRVLIICPASLKQQWAREITRFTEHAVQLVQGPPPERGVQYRREAVFFIINYELVLRDLTVINETLRPDLIIMDEAQRIKNWRTKIASAVKLISSRYAFVLSGTPLENRLEDLYSLMQMVDPKVLGPLWRYMIDFHVTDERGKVLGYRNLSLLRKRLAPVMLRRDRRLVRDQLPDRIVQRIDVAMTSKQAELHDAAMSAAGSLADIAKKRPLTPAEQHRLMAALQQARMACDAAGLVDRETEGSPKIDELASLLEELCLQSGLKVVVFSQWERMTRMVETRLVAMGLGCVRLHGGVPVPKRGELMDRFREDDSVQVFVSTDAGGVGLNLQSGSVVINLDVPWNPAVLEQRNGRVHRLGQTRKVQIINLVAADSYEEHVLTLVRNKQHLFDNVIDEDASEDVVGVSKKLLETLLEDLAAPEPAETDETGESETETSTTGAATSAETADVVSAPYTDGATEQAITECINQLQQAFGPRIERVLGAGGGLVVVMDRVDPEADQVAARLSRVVPVALVDPITLAGLARLGAASPVAADARSLYDAASDSTLSGRSRLAQLAGEKFRAALMLLEQGLADSGLELLMSALLAIAGDRAGLASPVSLQEAAVWTYAEAIPQGVLREQEAALLMRGIGLSQAASAPVDLIRALATEAEEFIASVAS